jgi:hypothetical protein
MKNSSPDDPEGHFPMNFSSICDPEGHFPMNFSSTYDPKGHFWNQAQYMTDPIILAGTIPELVNLTLTLSSGSPQHRKSSHPIRPCIRTHAS